MARRRNADVGERLVQATAELSAASTATTLVSSTVTAALSNSQIKVASVYWSADAQTTLSLHDSSTGSSTDTVKWKQFVPARGGMTDAAPRGEFLFTATTGNEVTLVNSAAANVFVSVLYEATT